jgi:hypothetical protein
MIENTNRRLDFFEIDEKRYENELMIPKARKPSKNSGSRNVIAGVAYQPTYGR